MAGNPHHALGDAYLTASATTILAVIVVGMLALIAILGMLLAGALETAIQQRLATE